MSNQLPLNVIIERIDEVNAQDPNKELAYGKEYPKELLYGRRMSDTLHDCCIHPSYHLQIAVRASHIERWVSPRSDYPSGRSGYKKWRANLALFHANRVAEIMSECRCNASDIDRVKYIIQKRKMRSDSESQTLEDIACLVFLKYYFADFSLKHSDEKIIDILRKTWKKMSEKGHKFALDLELPGNLSSLVSRALNTPVVT